MIAYVVPSGKDFKVSHTGSIRQKAASKKMLQLAVMETDE